MWLKVNKQFNVDNKGIIFITNNYFSRYYYLILIIKECDFPILIDNSSGYFKIYIFYKQNFLKVFWKDSD